MSHARTAAIRLTPFSAALLSAKNSASLVLDRLYGTKERAQGTMAVALLLAVLGVMLNGTAHQLAAVCTM